MKQGLGAGGAPDPLDQASTTKDLVTPDLDNGRDDRTGQP